MITTGSATKQVCLWLDLPMHHSKNNLLLSTLYQIFRKLRVAISLGVVILSLAAFTPVNWKLSSSAVTFKIKHAGLVVNGSLAGTQTDINFDPANPTQSSIVASLESATIETGIALRNKHLRKEQYLHVDKYPRITMRSTKIEKTGSNSYLGHFDLEIKETTKNIQVPFTFTEKGPGGEFRGEFKINRLDYKVGEANWLMDNEALISIQLNVTR
jgi:polyisoprenoid-binding protein YceI